MTYDANFFTPENVDEQVDKLSQLPTRGHLSGNGRTEGSSQAGANLVRDLQAYYQDEQQEDSASLERAWTRISARLPEDRERFHLIKTQPLPLPISERSHTMRHTVSDISRGGNFSRRLSLLVAVLVCVLLVGGLAVVLNLSHHKNATGSPIIQTKQTPTTKSTPTATTIPASDFGKTLYTTPANQWGFESLAWSPDSKRVASATVDNKGVQFWDATTGAHLVTVHLPGGTSEWAYGLDWSPNSEEVAVGTNQHILIVNGDTGKIINSFSAGGTAVNSSNSGQTYLSSFFPFSGGFGYRAVAWSPDGHLIATALSFGVNGEVEVLNPQTGATDFTLSVGDSNNIGALAWSSDGRYLAATTWNTQGIDPTQPTSMVIVWNASTHQMVFQHKDFLNTGAPLVWQPESHNLAFVGATLSGQNIISTLEIWDATTGKQVKRYVGTGTGALAWSPDGRYLAYANFGGKDNPDPVIILDVATGKQVYVYRGHHLPVSVIAWSPNEKYIVSGEGNTQGNMVAKVWTA